MEKILEIVNQNVQEPLKKFHVTKIKEHEMTQKQIKEIRKDLNKYKSETKDTIKSEIHELKSTEQIIKVELNKYLENLRKKNQTEILEIKSPYSQTKNKMEGHSSRLEQVEDRISELKDEREKKEKAEEILVKQPKSCERNMQEFSKSIKRANQRIIGIEEGEEVQAKGICNMFNKIITENFPNLEKVLSIQVQEASRTPNRLDQNRTSPRHIIIKTTSRENRERILKAVREKKTNNI
jgi:chromosome segregation ATPase